MLDLLELHNENDLKFITRLGKLKNISNKKTNNNILFLIPTLSGGGAERVVVNEATYLSKNGYNVFVGTLFEVDKQLEYNFHCCYIPSNLSNERFNTIEKIIEENNISLVYSHSSWCDYYYLDLYLAKYLGCRVIAVKHEDIYYQVIQNIYSKTFIRMINVFQCIDVVRVLKPTEQQFFNALNCKTILIGNDTSYVEKYKIIEKPENKPKYLLYLGSFSKIKGVDFLFEVFNNLLHIRKDIKLLIVGRYNDYLGRLLVQYQAIMEHIEFMDSIKDLDKVFNKSKLLLLLGKHEAYPMVMQEAKYFGVPTLLFNISLLNDKFENGVIKVFKENKEDYLEKIIQIFDDEDFYQQLSTNAKEDFIKNNNNLEKILNLIQQISNDTFNNNVVFDSKIAKQLIKQLGYIK